MGSITTALAAARQQQEMRQRTAALEARLQTLEQAQPDISQRLETLERLLAQAMDDLGQASELLRQLGCTGREVQS